VLYSFTDDHADTLQISLPAELPVNPYVTEYRIAIANGPTIALQADDIRVMPPAAYVEVKADSLTFGINTENTMPFWYTVYADNKVVLRGHSLDIDTTIAFSHRKYATVVATQLYAGRLQYKTEGNFYDGKALNLLLSAPAVVYPGQEVDMEVKVTDKKAKVMPNMDVAAYAHTAKFTDFPGVHVPLFIKRKPKYSASRVGTYLDVADNSGKMKLNWNKWGKLLGLDTMFSRQA
jgi:hypothetical protein